MKPLARCASAPSAEAGRCGRNCHGRIRVTLPCVRGNLLSHRSASIHCTSSAQRASGMSVCGTGWSSPDSIDFSLPKVHLSYNKGECDALLQEHIEGWSLVGFDTEWRPVRQRGQKPQLALLQVSRTKTKCYFCETTALCPSKRGKTNKYQATNLKHLHLSRNSMHRMNHVSRASCNFPISPPRSLPLPQRWCWCH